MKKLGQELPRKLHHSLVLMLSVLLVLQPMLAPIVYAQTVITPDTAAPTANQPTVAESLNHTPVENIATPNGGGVSHNKLGELQVGNEGLIVNNSASSGMSTIGSIVVGNGNLTSGNEARIIINEVTGTNPSSLQGPTEIFGREAEYVVANPNGISCNGCGFLKTPKVTLTTGVPHMDGAGNIDHITVDKGTVLIEGNGVDASQTDSFDIISRATQIHAAIYGGNTVRVTTGRNQVNYQTGVATPLAATPESEVSKPTIAIDASALGGMYAGKIYLKSTEAGVGVNNGGILQASNGNLEITADGELVQAGTASATADVKLTSTASKVTHTGRTSAGGSVTVNAQSDAQLSGQYIYAGDQLTLTAGNQLTLDGSGADSGFAFVKANTITGNADSIRLTHVLTSGTEDVISMTAASLDISDSDILANSVVFISTGATTITTSQIVANDGLSLTNGSFSATNSTLLANTLLQNVSGNWLNDTSIISMLGDLSLTVGGTLTNQGELSSATHIDISAHDLNNTATGVIASNNDALLGATHDLTNQGVLYTHGNMNIEVGNHLLNDQGYILAETGSLRIGGLNNTRMVLLENQSGLIQSGGLMTLVADTLSNHRVGNPSFTEQSSDIEYFDIRLGHGNDDMLAHTGKDNQWLIFNADPYLDGVKFMVDNNSTWQADPNLPPGVARQVITETEDFTERAGEIISQGNLVVDAATLNQQVSYISASGNVDLGNANVTNTGMDINSILRYTCMTSGCLPHIYNPVINEYDLVGSIAPLETFDLVYQSGHVASTIEAGGTLTLGGNLVNNQTSLPISGVLITPRIDQSSVVSPGVNVSVGGLFGVASDPNSPYLITTQIPNINQNGYVGSSYLLDQLGYQLDHTILLLGDPFYETQLIEDALLKKLGTRFITPGITNANAQITQLYDNAKEQMGTLNLSVGIALTDSQQSLLTKDIVWLVQQTINGKQVLVPTVYLSSSHAQLQDIALNTGATLNGHDIALTGNSITNQGGIQAQHNVTINSSTVSNQGGLIKAGNNLDITADTISNSASVGSSSYGKSTFETLQHQGTLAAGNNVNLNTSGDIHFNGGVLDAGGTGSLTSTNGNIIIDSQALNNHTDASYRHSHYTSDSTLQIGSLLSGQQLVLNAANDITIKGSDAQSAGDINLTAQNVTIGAETESYHYHETSSSHGFMSSSKKEVKQDQESLRGSTLTAGNNININANDDINVTASYAEAGNDIHLLADADHNDTGGITVEAGKGYESSYVYKKDSGFTGGLSGMSFGVSYQQTKDRINSYQETLLPSMMVAGHDITMDAHDDINILSSQLQAGHDVILNSDNNINLLALDADNSYAESHKMNSIGVSVAIQEGFTGLIDSLKGIGDKGSGSYAGIQTAADIYKGVFQFRSMYNASKGFIDPSQLLPSISVSLGISSSSSKYETSGSNFTQASISAGHDFISQSGKDTIVKGANIQAKNVNMDIGDNLDIESVQNVQKTSQSSHSGGLSVGISYGVNGLSPTFGANASASSGDGHRNWTDNVTSIIGTNSITINTDGKTMIKGALVAQATPQEDGTYMDGGNLTLNTDSLVVSDLTDEDIWNSSGAGMAVGFGGQPGQPVFGSGSNLSSSYTPSLQIAQDTTIGVTHATIGNGTININNTVATNDQLKGINRDINKTQEILVDKHDHLDVEVPIDGKTLQLTLSFIGDAATSVNDKLSQLFSQAVDQAVAKNVIDPEDKANVNAILEALKDGDLTTEQLVGCGQVSFNIKSLFIQDAYAAGGMCELSLQGKTVSISEKTASEAHSLYKGIMNAPDIGNLYNVTDDLAFDNECNLDPSCQQVSIDASLKTLKWIGFGIPVVLSGGTFLGGEVAVEGVGGSGMLYSDYMAAIEGLDVTTAENSAVFYSGPGNKALAEEFAFGNGKLTLEMTPGGRWLESQNLYSNENLTMQQADSIWGSLSQKYASQASGSVTAFTEGASSNSIFNTIEYPTLITKPNIKSVDFLTGGF
ncbi:MAG: hemagglutinin repeat-containing protein [Alphaproteobacteria bacterium]|nr:hemagglutinin repeat-containing protein [Alphaproteobacteria bacterium]